MVFNHEEPHTLSLLPSINRKAMVKHYRDLFLYNFYVRHSILQFLWKSVELSDVFLTVACEGAVTAF